MDDNSVYLNLFFEESDDNLALLNDSVLQLESDPQNMDLINEIFRAAHTLKGMSATMGYDVMTKITHKMENLFDFFKTGKLQVTSEYISIIFDCLDTLSQLVEDLREGNELQESQISGPLAKIAVVEAQVNGEAPVAASSTVVETTALDNTFPDLDAADVDVINAAVNDGHNAFQIGVRIDPESALKGARVFLVMEKLGQGGDVIVVEPDTERLEAGDFDTDFKFIYVTKNAQAEVASSIANISEIDQILVDPFGKVTAAEPTPSAPVAASTPAQSTPAVVATPAAPVEKAEAKHNHPQKAANNQSIRVDLNRLDLFLNIVSELVVYRNQLEDASKRDSMDDVKDSLEHVSRLTSELQDLVLKIRMQQVNVVFSRFPRMVRDLSQQLGKDIELIIKGEETELDKTVVAELSEPLIHLFRNSLDHGIELPDVREAHGKPRQGVIELSAMQEGNKVHITLKDDGKGLDPVAIRASAERKGINTEGMSEDEVKKLVFHPGFSTSQEVTNISGRGVGLDAVVAKIVELGGAFDLTSEVNVGTTFTIKLPLTLSIIQALLVKVGTETFATPLDVVERVVMVTEDEITMTGNQEVYAFQGMLIPVLRTDKVLDIPGQAIQRRYGIVVKLENDYFMVLVDQLLGQQEIVIKKIDSLLQQLNRYQGATILGNGSVALILDVNAICHATKGGTLNEVGPLNEI
ncbi:chemotaxis protein CheA [Periweissella ghanensis]|uniref:Chemotaxis protein CheA n=1 Tax=Periweissella ghanensis TaxID=467997 RepID=A0ABN8BJM7_9LACO|nr:chemotaxis protein CheA [Periweissella ghanensis]MCM0601013.1 chemotaxis protein CheA [Periweissella ghanensis]CAH0417906.1 Chemotaxis protein CheA [Periweissella ghanensis]